MLPHFNVRRYKLPLQTVAFVAMMVLPVLLYIVAQAGNQTGTILFLILLGLAMALAVWVG